MTLQSFIEDFTLLADAPNSVAKLRELILQLAVEGKLIAQDPSDEPASKLLQRIKADKEKLAKTGNGNKKAVADAYKGDRLFTIPKDWEWVCLDQITNTIHYGYTASANELLTDVRLLRITDIQNGKVNWASVPGCEIEKEKAGGYKLANNDILIARTGGTIGKSYLVENLDLVAVFASYLIRAIPNRYLFAKYLKIFLESDLYWKQLYERSMGTGQPNVNATSLKSLAVPLPPLEEQKRIVTKVDELMWLCNELEGQQQAQRESRVRLNTAILAPLNNAASLTPQEFDQATTRLNANFATLYDSIDTLSKLRATILELAVQGKLVSQERSDEPAAVLLKRIGQQRQKLLTPSELKKVESQRASDQIVLPFGVPEGWEWTRLGEISTKLGAGSTPLGGKNVYQREGVKFLRSQNVWDHGLKLDNVAYISELIHKEMNGTHVQDGDILLNITGASIGRCCVVPEPFGEANVSQHVSIIRLVDRRLRFFIHLCIISPYVQESIMRTQVGISREGLSMRSLKEFLLPIPPLAEQTRIVTRVNQLMSLCDELESKLRQAETDSEKLMNAAVKHILDSVRDNSKDAKAVFT